MSLETLKIEKIDRILEGLVGSIVQIKYVSSADEENEVSGVLETVDKYVIQIREPLLDSTYWINRNGVTLTSVRLLQRKK